MPDENNPISPADMPAPEPTPDSLEQLRADFEAFKAAVQKAAPGGWNLV